jgi:hypothetical protein
MIPDKEEVAWTRMGDLGVREFVSAREIGNGCLAGWFNG